jgi:hypothetical protein
MEQATVRQKQIPFENDKQNEQATAKTEADSSASLRNDKQKNCRQKREFRCGVKDSLL